MGRTILSGGGSSGVLSVTGAGITAIIRDLTVRDGNVVGGIAHGAGMLINGNLSVFLSRTVFTNNIVNANGAPGNSGGIGEGAAIYNTGGTLTVEDSSLVGNSGVARGSDGHSGGISQGGAIYNLSGVVTVTRSNLSGNSVDARGGGGPSSGTQAGGIAQGGGIYDLPAGVSPLNITSSTLGGNSTDASGGPGSSAGIAQGGGLYALGGTVLYTISNSSIANNSVKGRGGGGITQGGGYYRLGSDPTRFVDSTIAGNSVEGANPIGGNLAVGAPTFRNSIISGGQANPGSENCTASGTSLGHNIESTDQCGLTTGSDQKNTDPKLAALQDNGGPGPTVGFGPDSPAFDKGDLSTCPTTDERGVTRPQGAGCDVGAFELELADLGLRGSADKTKAKIGSKVTFTLSASNGGSGTGHATTITDALPSGLTLVSATPSSGACTGSATVSCVLGEFGAGGAGGATIVARATKPGVQTSKPSIGSLTVDLAEGNNALSFPVTVGKLAVGTARLSPSTFRLGSKLPKLSKVRTGTTIRFSLPEAARVKLSFARKHGKRFRKAGSLTVRGHAGLNKLRFQGRLSKRKTLKPGRYQLTLRATDRFRNRSATRKLKFTLLAP
jgi:uncharacterized repeat protein (TIGR01451 family)